MLLFLILTGCITSPIPSETPSDVGQDTTDSVVVAMRKQPLQLTFHGECRMECRRIDRQEVEAILHGDGVRRPERTRTDGECPTHALEGRTRDGQNARLVFAACPDETRLVTAIDLDTDWPCGDC